jgi:hypothetical protein
MSQTPALFAFSDKLVFKSETTRQISRGLFSPLIKNNQQNCLSNFLKHVPDKE